MAKGIVSSHTRGTSHTHTHPHTHTNPPVPLTPASPQPSSAVSLPFRSLTLTWALSPSAPLVSRPRSHATRPRRGVAGTCSRRRRSVSHARGTSSRGSPVVGPRPCPRLPRLCFFPRFFPPRKWSRPCGQTRSRSARRRRAPRAGPRPRALGRPRVGRTHRPSLSRRPRTGRASRAASRRGRGFLNLMV